MSELDADREYSAHEVEILIAQARIEQLEALGKIALAHIPAILYDWLSLLRSQLDELQFGSPEEDEDARWCRE